MKLIDCNGLPRVAMRNYGGATGSKIAVRYDGEVYMLKWQQALKERNMKNVEISWANDPITEYIGSHVYSILDIPVHETLLGERGDKMCVLCKDLAYPDRIVEFRELRNSIVDWSMAQPSSGMSSNLIDILEVIEKADYINSKEALARFWLMFVIDSLIGNTDRNNGNWGFLPGDHQKYVLCPVYDCGGCLNNKRSDHQMQVDIESGEIRNLALRITFNFKVGGHRVNPFKYMRENMNPYVAQALQKVIFMNFTLVEDMIDNVKPVISDVRARYYKEIMRIRLEELRKIYSEVCTEYKETPSYTVAVSDNSSVRVEYHGEESTTEPTLFKHITSVVELLSLEEISAIVERYYGVVPVGARPKERIIYIICALPDWFQTPAFTIRDMLLNFDNVPGKDLSEMRHILQSCLLGSKVLQVLSTYTRHTLTAPRFLVDNADYLQLVALFRIVSEFELTCPITPEALIGYGIRYMGKRGHCVTVSATDSVLHKDLTIDPLWHESGVRYSPESHNARYFIHSILHGYKIDTAELCQQIEHLLPTHLDNFGAIEAAVMESLNHVKLCDSIKLSDTIVLKIRKYLQMRGVSAESDVQWVLSRLPVIAVISLSRLKIEINKLLTV